MSDTYSLVILERKPDIYLDGDGNIDVNFDIPVGAVICDVRVLVERLDSYDAVVNVEWFDLTPFIYSYTLPNHIQGSIGVLDISKYALQDTDIALVCRRTANYRFVGNIQLHYLIKF